MLFALSLYYYGMKSLFSFIWYINFFFLINLNLNYLLIPFLLLNSPRFFIISFLFSIYYLLFLFNIIWYNFFFNIINYSQYYIKFIIVLTAILFNMYIYYLKKNNFILIWNFLNLVFIIIFAIKLLLKNFFLRNFCFLFSIKLIILFFKQLILILNYDISLFYLRWLYEILNYDISLFYFRWQEEKLLNYIFLF